MDLKGPLFIINSEAIYKAKKKLQNNGKFDGSFTHTHTAPVLQFWKSQFTL